MHFYKELTKTQGHIYVCYSEEELRVLAWSLGTSTRSDVLLEVKQFAEDFWRCTS